MIRGRIILRLYLERTKPYDCVVLDVGFVPLWVITLMLYKFKRFWLPIPAIQLDEAQYIHWLLCPWWWVKQKMGLWDGRSYLSEPPGSAKCLTFH